MRASHGHGAVAGSYRGYGSPASAAGGQQIRGPLHRPPTATAFAEAVIQALAVSLLLTFGVGWFGGRLIDPQEFRREERALDLLAETVDAISAYPFEDLERLHQREFGDRASVAESDFAVTVEVANTSADTVAVTAVLSDRRSGAELSRSVTYRGRAEGD